MASWILSFRSALMEALVLLDGSVMSRTFTFPPPAPLAPLLPLENGQSSASMRRPSKTNLFKAFMRLNSISSRKDFLCFGSFWWEGERRWRWRWKGRRADHWSQMARGCGNGSVRLLSQALFQRYVCRLPPRVYFHHFHFWASPWSCLCSCSISGSPRPRPRPRTRRRHPASILVSILVAMPCTSNWHFSLSHCARQQQRERQQNGRLAKSGQVASWSCPSFKHQDNQRPVMPAASRIKDLKHQTSVKEDNKNSKYKIINIGSRVRSNSWIVSAFLHLFLKAQMKTPSLPGHWQSLPAAEPYTYSAHCAKNKARRRK